MMCTSRGEKTGCCLTSGSSCMTELTTVRQLQAHLEGPRNVCRSDGGGAFCIFGQGMAIFGGPGNGILLGGALRGIGAAAFP
jgi:hypothetical protein